MMIKKLLFLVLMLVVAGCSSMIQSASITEAYKKFEAQDYESTLELITRAENINDSTPEMKAEVTYLKAQAHEGLGNHDIANTLYEYLVGQHQDSQYGYLASKKLNNNL